MEAGVCWMWRGKGLDEVRGVTGFEQGGNK